MSVGSLRTVCGAVIVVAASAVTWSVLDAQNAPAKPPAQTPAAPQAPAGPPLGPDSQVQPGTPAGDVIKAEFAESKVYPGTWREYWVYVPKQLDRAKPAPVMVFQDGLQYNAPVVFDNLIHKKAIPPMVGVFVMHGRVKAPSADALDRMNRSFEYDAVSGDYARFLLDELLPHVAKTHGLTLSTDRTIARSPETAAARSRRSPRPGSAPTRSAACSAPSAPTSGLRGGNEFPLLIRKTEPKPIRVFLQDGSQRSEQLHRQLVDRQPGHAVGARIRRLRRQSRVGRRRAQFRHAGAIFPDALRWLWRDWPAPIKANPEGKSQQDVFQVLIPGEDVAARERGPPRHRRPCRECQGGDVLHRPCEQPDSPRRIRRQGGACSRRTRTAPTA